MKDIKETQRHIQKIEEENGEEKVALLHCLAGLHQLRFQLAKALLEKAGDEPAPKRAKHGTFADCRLLRLGVSICGSNDMANACVQGAIVSA